MAGIPGAYGGDRVLLADPVTAGTAVAVGDVAAIAQQLLHVLQPIMVPAGLDAERIRLNDALNNARLALDQQRDRELSTRALMPMSRQRAAWGATDNLANVRLNQLPQFDGESRDEREVTRWLNRMINASESHTLNEAATINLLIHCSKGPASDLVDRMRAEGKNYLDIARALELRFGNLCTSDEAVVKCNTMPRYHGEDLTTFLDRLRHVAEMAKRSVADPATRLAAVDTLVESNIRRVLPNSVREALEERILARTRMGQPPFTLAEIEKETLELERKREARHLKRRSRAGTRHVRAVQHPPYSGQVNQVYLQATTSSNSYDSYPDSFSEDEMDELGADGIYAAPEVDCPNTIALVNNLNQVDNRYQSRGVQPNPDQIFQKAVRRYNRYPQQGPMQPQRQGMPPGQSRPNPGFQGQGRPRNYDRPQARQVTAQGYPGQPQGYPAPQPAYQGPQPGQLGQPGQPRGHPGQQQPYPGQQPQQGGGQPPAPYLRPAGPPNRIPDGRFNLQDLLTRSNCVAGECIKCGRAGHLMSHDACPLRGKPLQDRVCVKCKKGLHGVNDCLQAYQPPVQGQINQVYVAEWSDDSDDLNE